MDRHVTAVLLKIAHRKYKRILPCSNDCHELRWIECVEIYNDEYYLWFNTVNGSTHLIHIKISELC
jgi:hypothetical protein